MSLLEIEQKKGSAEYIDGRLTVYATVDVDPAELAASSHPLYSVVHNGLLVAQGNYKEQSSLKDFLQVELGGSLEEGLEVFLERLDGLEGALDPQKLKDKLKNLDDLKDFIPTPAKIVPFNSETEILKQEGDVFFVGAFKNMANANLSVNSFPIVYQARYREQEIDMVRSEIDQIITQIESAETAQKEPAPTEREIDKKIVSEYIPLLLYSRKDPADFENAVRRLKDFLRGYRFPADIEKIVFLIRDAEKLTTRHYKLLELYAMKIDEVSRGSGSGVDSLEKQIKDIEEELAIG